jgi:hypothetical protein
MKLVLAGESAGKFDPKDTSACNVRAIDNLEQLARRAG